MGGYEHHPIFERPPIDATIWRYMDFPKFVDLIDRSTLFFSRADRLGDSWEGSLSRATLQIEAAQLRRGISNTERGERNVEQLREDSARYRERLAMFIMVCCWHEADHESAAMWKMYACEGAGIAVRSSFGALERALPRNFPQFIYAGRVRYIDYAQQPVPSSNSYFPFLFKRSSYDHEREVRAMFDASTLENLHPSYLNPPMIESGVHVPVDLDLLISAIHVAPAVPSWLFDLVTRTATRYGLRASVVRSSLDGGPVY
jgi:hypothetical protein